MLNIQTFLEKYFTNDEKIILACSAWPDSMFLLYKILETSFRNNLVVCYFNHKTRPETDLEEKFLEELATKENFSFEVAECDFEKIKKLYPSKSFEELAREKRYQFFSAILNIYNSNYILTAHHLDDKIETFLFNLARWSKLTWFINMQEKSSWILRPLLNITKKEIENYLNENSLKYFIDSTNFDTEISRNHLRIEVIPKLEKINKNFKQNINNTLLYFAELKDFIDEEVKEFLNPITQPHPKQNPPAFGIPLDNGDKKNWKNFLISEFNKKSPFLQKEIIRYIYYISNFNSTIWLSEANIAEVLRFINGKNNKTVKEIRNMKLEKDNKIIWF